MDPLMERFTDNARKVMTLANQEAQRRNHDHIGPEHILLGLIKVGTGVGATILKNLSFDWKKIRLEVEKLMKGGSDIVTTGKLPQTPLAKKVIEYACEEARALNHNYVGTEHLLLGLLRVEEGTAGQVLGGLGVKIHDVQFEILKNLGEITIGEVDKRVQELTKDIPFYLKKTSGDSEDITSIEQEIRAACIGAKEYNLISREFINKTMESLKTIVDLHEKRKRIIKRLSKKKTNPK